ncbi:ACA11, partial [Symbiodinium sp. KB8]
EIKRNKSSPYLLSGAKVEHGAGRMLVLNVGVHSAYGKIVVQLQDEVPPPTPLQERLDKLAKQIGFLGIGAGILTFAVLVIIWLAQDHDGQDVLKFFVLGVTIAVVAVPEGLPLAVTLSLAFSVKRMLTDKNLVREMRACETMGSATTICSDKTGTLTENRMSVTRVWVKNSVLDGATIDANSFDGKDSKLWKLFIQSVCLNSDAQVGAASVADVRIERDGHVDFEGNKTEGHYVYRENFSSQRKRMTTVVEDTIEPGSNSYLVSGALTKGASEKVLTFCSTYLDSDGNERVLDDDVSAAAVQERTRLGELIDSLASQGLRTLSLSFKRLSKAEFPAPTDEEGWIKSFAEELEQDQEAPAVDTSVIPSQVEENMTLLAIAGIKDPVRPQVPKAVADCQNAGIVVRMVTGDNMLTAQQIAKECGILPVRKQFRTMEKEERLAMLPRLRVLARSSPMDKHLLVTNLKELGDVVSVTGDGTNDAPALRAAHVGLAMNIAGTEVAKEASKIVILDDNFASIAKSVMWGRSIFENIQKFLVFQLTINVVALLATFVVACTNEGSTSNFPITPVQLLWINLIMDSFAALALATEPPDPTLMEQKPHGKKEALITPVSACRFPNVTLLSIYNGFLPSLQIMWKYILAHGSYQTFLILLITKLDTAATVVNTPLLLVPFL